jgi:DnaJ-class molecular chaperone
MIKEEDKCITCNGTKLVEKQIMLRVDVSKGVREGDHVILSGLSDEFEEFEEAGDLYVFFKEEKRIGMNRVGDNLHVSKDILLTEALCGLSMTYKHPNGETIMVEYHNIIKPHGVYKIPGLGFFNKDKDANGDMVFEFNIIFPDKIAEDKREYIRKILPQRKSNGNGQSSVQSLRCYHLETGIDVQKIPHHIETDVNEPVNECKTQ